MRFAPFAVEALGAPHPDARWFVSRLVEKLILVTSDARVFSGSCSLANIAKLSGHFPASQIAWAIYKASYKPSRSGEGSWLHHEPL